MMLYSLPRSYENFRLVIESRKKLPSLENLKIKLIEESQSHYKTTSFITGGVFFNKN